MIDSTISTDLQATLRPCPFCGDTAELTCIDGEYMIGCSNNESCSVYVVAGPYQTQTEAVEIWNHRA